jgi:hypothetical protein
MAGTSPAMTEYLNVTKQKGPGKTGAFDIKKRFGD